jgi:VanZ family protein
MRADRKDESVGYRARDGRRARAQRPLVTLWSPLLVWMGLLWVLSDQSTLGPASSWLGRANADKVAHAIAFGVLAVLFYRPMAFRRIPLLSSAPVFCAVLFALLYGILDECHQAHVPGRDPSVWDLAADLTGASLAGMVLILWSDRPRGPSRVGDMLLAARAQRRGAPEASRRQAGTPAGRPAIR